MKVVFRWIRTSGASQSPGVARQRALSSFSVSLSQDRGVTFYGPLRENFG